MTTSLVRNCHECPFLAEAAFCQNPDKSDGDDIDIWENGECDPWLTMPSWCPLRHSTHHVMMWEDSKP